MANQDLTNDVKFMRRVIFASSLGTVFEWYDFYLYGSLAVFFGTLFFPKGDETIGFLASLATFGAGFAVRPFGALVFGRIGDVVGRKYTFLVTIVVMGGSTFLVGLMPTYEQIGIWAPILLTVLRLAQGLALGGEYGGAATFVAEHSPNERRGFYTSGIQTTATLGFLLSLIVILICRSSLGDAQFKIWGWRIPFLVSFVLLLLSVYIRLKLDESPVFLKLKSSGKTSKSPLRESFLRWSNLKIVLIALFGATAGQGVVWYTGQFYALFFLQNTLKIEYHVAYLLIAVALVIATPFFVFFGHLSDKIGRKKIIMVGLIVAAAVYLPIFKGLTHFGNPALEQAINTSPIVIQYSKCDKECALMQDFLAKKGYKYENKFIPEAAALSISVGSAQIQGAAFLVEIFPTSIRYTSMSLPYHLGNGWFGGFLPLIAASVVVKTGNIYAGLYYPIAVALMSFVLGMYLIKKSKGHDIDS